MGVGRVHTHSFCLDEINKYLQPKQSKQLIKTLYVSPAVPNIEVFFVVDHRNYYHTYPL